MSGATKRSLLASTSASTLSSKDVRFASSSESTSLLANDTEASGRNSRPIMARQPQRRAVNQVPFGWTRSVVAASAVLLQAFPLVKSQDVPTGSLEARDETLQTRGETSVHISRNLPIQIVIIIGCIVLFAMFITTIACFFRKSPRSNRKSTGRGDHRATRKNAWSPGGSSSIYTFGSESLHSSNSIIKEKSRKSSSALSPVSPMPALKNEHGGSFESYTMLNNEKAGGIAIPQPTALTPHSRGKGWQLFDNPVPTFDNNSKDVESAGMPPARRPSFIDRLLAHRADPNDARLPNSQLDLQEGFRSPSGRKISGSALLSVLSGPLNPLRNRDASQRLAVVESDFEGTIGGRDGEIPMAKRIRHSQGRIVFDDTTDAPTPVMQVQHLSDRFSPLPTRFFSKPEGTPRTPGLAGVGATWNQVAPPANVRSGQGRVASFAELQRQPVSAEDANRWSFQSTIDQWVQGSRFAGVPPPSRRGSTNSFLTARGAAAAAAASPSLVGITTQSDDVDSLERMVSIRPHFAATTTLASWLIQEEDDNKECYTDNEANSIIEKYLVCGSRASSDTDFDRKRGMLWEAEEPPLLPCYQSTNGHATQGHEEEPEEVLEEEVVDEERRQVEKREKQILKEKRRAERRAARKQSEIARQLQTSLMKVDQVQEEENQMHHLVVEMDDRREEESVVQHQLRLYPSLNGFHAPVLSHQSDQVVSQSRRSSRKMVNHSNERRSSRVIVPLSPPESPLTSASEGPSRSHHRGPGSFLVPSSRSRSSTHSGSQRSVSHGSVLMSQSGVDTVVMEKRLPRRQPRQQHTSSRCVSERPSHMS